MPWMQLLTAAVVLAGLSALASAQAPPVAAPAAPTDLTAVPASASHFDLAWTDNADNEAGFRIERKGSAGGAWVLVGEVPAGVAAFQSAGCLKETSYAHRVCAWNAAGRSGWAQAAAATTRRAFDAPRGRVIAPTARGNPRNGEGALAKLRDGSLLYVYSRRAGRGDLDPSALAARTSADGGRSWSDETVVLADGKHTVSHVGLARTADGALGMSYIVIRGRDDAEMLFRRSADEGRTWSPPVRITDGRRGYMTGPHDALRRFGPRRLVQVCHARDERRRMRTLVYTSDDDGRTWQRRTPAGLLAPGKGMSEGSIAALSAPGHLLMYARTTTDWFWESRSADHGTTWSKPVRSAVRNPQAPAKLYNVPGSKAIVLLHCPYVAGVTKWPNGQRWILAARITTDDGRTWRNYKQLEYSSHNEWYHYPCLLFDGEAAHVAYYYGTNRATHQSTRYQKLPKTWFLHP